MVIALYISEDSAPVVTPEVFPDRFQKSWSDGKEKLPGKTSAVTTGAESSEIGRAITIYQDHLSLSEVIYRYQEEASEARFSSLLTIFSKVLENLK